MTMVPKLGTTIFGLSEHVVVIAPSANMLVVRADRVTIFGVCYNFNMTVWAPGKYSDANPTLDGRALVESVNGWGISYRDLSMQPCQWTKTVTDAATRKVRKSIIDWVDDFVASPNGHDLLVVGGIINLQDSLKRAEADQDRAKEAYNEANVTVTEAHRALTSFKLATDSKGAWKRMFEEDLAS